MIVFLVFATTLTGTLLIPAVRPFFAAFHGGDEAAMHAFMSVNMLGAAIGAPFVAWIADRTGRRRALATLLLLIDGGAMLVAATAEPVALVLAVRAVQGAASVGALSIIMGAVRSERQGKAMGAVSAAIVFAIACGAPLGTVCVKIGPRAALWASACVSLLAAVLVQRLQDGARVERSKASFRDVERGQRLTFAIAATFVALERFAVGSFVVTFPLYAHTALGKSDAQVGALFSAFLLPFAVASVFVGFLLARGIDRVRLVLFGGVVYGGAVALFGQTSGAALWSVLVVAGLASASIYAPALYLASGSVPVQLKATAMGLVNASSTLGMMLGTAAAGVVSMSLAARGLDPNEARRWIFLLAGGGASVAFLVGGVILRFGRTNRDT